MRKWWKRLAVFALLAAALTYGAGLLKDHNLLEENLLRLHVVANSDTQADQSVKLRVRDAVLEQAGLGVEDVDRFDETGIVMSTSAGTLVVTGEDLHIGKLSLDGGELHVDGRIDAVSYEDGGQERQGFFRRLFG